MTDQRTLKNIINKQRKTITQLEITCQEFAKDLDETIQVAAESIKDYQGELEQVKNELEEYKQLRASLLKQHMLNCDKISQANKILDDEPEFNMGAMRQKLLHLRFALKIPRKEPQEATS